MIHSFSVAFAEKYGVNAAIIFQHLAHWIKHNEANGVNYFDGNYWTYNSVKAFSEIFPYMSRRQIETALQKLIEAGLVITGNFNKATYDRTLWYAFTQNGKCISQNEGMDLHEMGNGFTQNAKPIPDNKPIINSDSKPYINNTSIQDDENTKTKSSIQDITYIVDFLNEKAKTNYRSSTPKTKSLIQARMSEGFTVNDFKRVIEKKAKQWIGTKWEKYLRPETLFGTKFEAYLNEPEQQNGGRVNPVGGYGDDSIL